MAIEDIIISKSSLRQLKDALVMAAEELAGAGHEGWVCTTGIEEEIEHCITTIESLLKPRAPILYEK